MDKEKKFAFLRHKLFYIRKKSEICFKQLILYLQERYEKSWAQEVVFFIYFLFHRYSPKQFKFKCAPSNFRLIARQQTEWFDADRQGQLILLSTQWEKFRFSIKNALSGGACLSRLKKVLSYTFLTLSLEIYNPFNRQILKHFIDKKVALLEKMIDKIKILNGEAWDVQQAKTHIALFRQSSLLQERLIKQMHLAIRRQKPQPFIEEGQAAMQKGLIPILVSSGISGSYWIRGAHRQILGLFKPFDEEPHAPNNPAGPRMQGALGQRKTRIGCRVGESVHHEVGAFLVDKFFGFGIVPKTYYAAFSHQTFFLALENRFKRQTVKTKYGSFQEYVRGFIPFHKASNAEHKQIPVDELQLLIVLDVILGNTDRNAGNLLIGDEKIAAIDHGFCFPDNHLDDLTYWYWSYLEQGKEPLYPSLVELVSRFPIDQLSYKLRKYCFISLASINRMRERIALFAAGLKAGLAPAQLNKLMLADHLNPLTNLQETLPEAAAEQVRIFLEGQ